MAARADEVMGAGADEVATVGPTDRVADAVAVLADRGIGAVVVVDDDHRVVGIVSERDVVRLLAQDGSAVLERQVGDVMTSPVTTCTGDRSTRRLLATMTDGRFRHVPIVDDQQVLSGIVSIGDIVKATIERLRDERESLTEYVSGGY